MSPLRIHHRPSFRRAAASFIGITALALVAISPTGASADGGGTIAISAHICPTVAAAATPENCDKATGVGEMNIAAEDGSLYLTQADSTLHGGTSVWGEATDLPFGLYFIDKAGLQIPAGYQLWSYDAVMGDTGGSEFGLYANLTAALPNAGLDFVLVPIQTDSDGDGASDNAEIDFGSDPFDPASFPAGQAGPSDADDSDGDGAGDLTETLAGTDPYDASSFPAVQSGPSDADDSDGDGYGDKTETDAGTDPYDAASIPGETVDGGDADGDQVSDLDEINIYGTDPNNQDTDGDGAPDYAEIWAGSNPLDNQDWPSVQAGPESDDATYDVEDLNVAGTDANTATQPDVIAESDFAAASSDGTGGTAAGEQASASADLAPANDGTTNAPAVVSLPNTGAGIDSTTDSAIDANVLIALATAGTLFAGATAIRRRAS